MLAPRSRPNAHCFIQPEGRTYTGTTYALVGAENISAVSIL